MRGSAPHGRARIAGRRARANTASSENDGAGGVPGSDEAEP